MSKRKYSAIWLHFEDEDGHKAKCNYCKATLTFSGGCHSNLRRHLKLKHPRTPFNLETQVPMHAAVMNLEKPLHEHRSTSSQIRTIIQDYQTTEFINIPPPISKEEQIDRQDLTSEFINIPPSISKEEHIDRQVLKMIARGHHSLQLVEEPEFKKLIREVSKCPGYDLPSSETLSNILLPNIYMELLEDIKEKLQSASAVCLTTDRWTSLADASYLAVVAHYINADTELTSHLLACGVFKNKKTSEHFYKFLKKVTLDFEINHKIIAVLSDNAPNTVEAICKGEWQGIICFTHSLNLIIQDAITEFSDTINRVKEIAEYFHKSSYASIKLRTTEREMNLPELKLKQNTSRKWNSTFEMLQRIEQIKDAVISTLSLDRPDLMLTIDDWEVIRETIPILMAFNEVTVEVSKEKYISKATVLCNLLQNFISECLPLNEKVATMVTNLQRSLTSRFGNLEKCNLYAESIILDPRFKRKGFQNYDSYEQALRILRNKICIIKLPDDEEETSETPNTFEAEQETIWQSFDLDFNYTQRSDNDIAASISEFDKYMNEEYLDRKKDPLLWWQDRKNIYPRVYSYALKRLCIVATSVPCQRLFSANGQNIIERQNHAKPYNVEELIFVYNNM